jgi:predicted dehydrogenase
LSDQPIRVAVVGLGFMGRTHLAAYRAAERAGEPVRLVAVADSALARPGLDLPEHLRDPNRPGPAPDLAGLERFPDAQTLLARAAPDLVSVCTPTDTHVPMALLAMDRGAHVVLEKPVALDPDHIPPLIDASRRLDRVVMPAMCMRFWPGWDWLKARIDDRRFGSLRSLSLSRLGSEPTWSRDFYGDHRRSGGAMIDLHIHDADFVMHCLGTPSSVLSTGRPNHITTVYTFEGRAGLHVTAEGGWLTAQGFPFRMRFLAEFDEAVADFDLARPDPLHLTHQGRTEPVPVGTANAYEAQVAHAVRCVSAWNRGVRDTPRPSLEQAEAVTRLLKAERASLESGRPIPVTLAGAP